MKHIIYILVIFIFISSCKEQVTNKNNNTNKQFFLPDIELQKKTLEELRLLRNEVFARKGYVFKDENLNNYFNKKSWYTSNSNVSISFTNQEQSYIDKIKRFEKAYNKNKKCLHYINNYVRTIYPITGDNINSTEKFDIISNIDEYYKYNHIQEIKELICDGATIYDIDCRATDIKNIILLVYCNEHPIFYIISLKKNKILKKIKVVWSSLDEGEGDFVNGYYDIDFKLDEDNLEVYKIYSKRANIDNATKEEDLYKTVEISREITKYKLTDNGIIKL